MGHFETVTKTRARAATRQNGKRRDNATGVLSLAWLERALDAEEQVWLPLPGVNEEAVEDAAQSSPVEEETLPSGVPSHLPLDDTLSLYFRDVGHIPLLSREEEVELAQQMERGRKAAEQLRAEDLDAETRRRLEAWVEAGERARQRLIVSNARLVISLAKDYLGHGVPLQDLIQEGNMGLMRAVEKFDYRRGHRLSTYATWWIRQSLNRAVVYQGRTIRLPVHRQAEVQRLHRVKRELSKELGREPTYEELAAELGISAQRVEQLLQYAQQPVSLDKPVGENGENELADFVESDRPSPAEIVERNSLRSEIRETLKSLPTREARILELRYGLRDGREYSLREVGQRFGLTRERIRQLEQDALHRLRSPERAKRLRPYLS